MAARLSRDEVLGLFEKLSNWGRWGKEDERGALNFITEQKRVEQEAEEAKRLEQRSPRLVGFVGSKRDDAA